MVFFAMVHTPYAKKFGNRFVVLPSHKGRAIIHRGFAPAGAARANLTP
jgi:hypothetical protein